MTKAATIDLANIDLAKDCDAGFEFELTHPITKQGLGMFITVLGKESDVFRGLVRKRTNDRLRKQQDRQRRNKSEEVPTIEQIEAEAIDLLVTCTTGFRELVFNGPLTFTPENARKLYTERPWVRSQVDEAVGDLENFTKA